MADRKRLRFVRGPWQNRPLLDLAEPALDLNRLGENVLVVGNGTATPDEALMRDARQILTEKLEHHILPTSFGTTDIFCVTINIEPAYTTYLQGYEVFFISHQDSVTENVFIKLNDLPPILVKDILGQPVPRRYIRAGQFCAATFDGVNFRISAPVNVIPTIGDPLGPPVTIIVGAPNEPATLVEALDLLKEFIIQGPVTVIMRPVEEMDEYIWDHPQGHFVTLQGQPPVIATGAFTSMTGGSQNFDVNLVFSNIGAVPGDWVLITGVNGTGASPEFLEGVYEITGASGASVTIAHKGFQPSTMVQNIVTSISSMDVRVFKTQIIATIPGTTCLTVTTALTIQNAVFVGTGVGSGVGLISIEQWVDPRNPTLAGGLGLYLDYVGVVQFGSGILSAPGGKLYGTTIGVSSCDFGITSDKGNVIFIYGVTNANNNIGLYCVNNGFIYANYGGISSGRAVSIGCVQNNVAQNSGYFVAINSIFGLSSSFCILQFNGVIELVNGTVYCYNVGTSAVRLFSAFLNNFTFENTDPLPRTVQAPLVEAQNARIVNSTFTHLGARSACLSINGPVVLDSCTITGNASENTVDCRAGAITMLGCTLNSTNSFQSAILISASSLLASGCTFNNDTILCETSGGARFESDCVFTGLKTASQVGYFQAQYGATIDLVGPPSAAGQTSSPPFNTVGNFNAIVALR